MHIQSFLLSEPHLSLLESLFSSLKQALLSTSLPRLDCYLNEVTNEESVELFSEAQLLQVKAVGSMFVVGCL